MPHKKCTNTECKFIASFGYTGSGTQFCSKHKKSDMINLLCKTCYCGRVRPSYNYDGEAANYCQECKLEGMIHVNGLRCICGRVKPCFNFVNMPAEYCAKCKLEGMLNVKDKKCFCGKAKPNFNLEGLKPEYCSKCKKTDMIDVVHARCYCGKAQPSFNFEGYIAAYCSKCKEDNMVDVKSDKCYCKKHHADYNLFGLKPKFCVECKTSEMINIRNKCRSAPCCSSGNSKYNYYCTHCFSNLFPNDPLALSIRIKTKELIVRDFINANFEGFIHDTPLYTNNCECTHRRRIDHRSLIGNTLLCIETDETQHKRYNSVDEEIRYDDVYMIHGGKFIFIRFNPDTYKNKKMQIKNPNIKDRLPILKDEIEKQIYRIENDMNSEFLEIIYLYFDETPSTNVISAGGV
jgi:hypothetical protein